MITSGVALCPRCSKLPDVIVGSEVTLMCREHGHMAIGATWAKAVDHWNRYIAYVTAQAVGA